MTSDAELGRVGYEAYSGFTGGKAFDGRVMPTWSDLPARIQSAWQTAAAAIADSYDAALRTGQQ